MEMGKGNIKFYKAIIEYRTVRQNLRAITKGIGNSRTELTLKPRYASYPKPLVEIIKSYEVCNHIFKKNL